MQFKAIPNVRVYGNAAEAGVFDGALKNLFALSVWPPRARFQLHGGERRSVFVTVDVIGAGNTRSVVVHVRTLLAHTRCTTIAQCRHLFQAGDANGTVRKSIELALSTLRALRITVVAVLPMRT